MRSLKLFQKPHIVFEEEAQVVDLEFEHGDSFDAHSKGKAGVFVAIDVAVFENLRVNHAAAKDFDPAAVFTDFATCAAANHARYVHFGGWFGKREIRRTETDFGVFSEKLLNKIIKRLLEVGKRNIMVNIKTFDLVENTMSTRRDGLIAKHTTRRNRPDGWF